MAGFVPPNDYQHEDEEQDPSYHCLYIFGDERVGQYAGHLVNLVAHAHKNVGCEYDIEQWLIRNQD